MHCSSNRQGSAIAKSAELNGDSHCIISGRSQTNTRRGPLRTKECVSSFHRISKRNANTRAEVMGQTPPDGVIKSAPERAPDPRRRVVEPLDVAANSNR